jgi:protein subunit release factor B
MRQFRVSANKQRELEERMQSLGVSENELEEKFIHSSGPGGQNVNKVSTCVVLTHIPTGIKVRCQETRYQALNRFLARRRLLDLIEKRQKGFVEEERKRIEKIRRQKRRRSKRAKEKMLEAKRRQSEKKRLRGKIEISSDDEL